MESFYLIGWLKVQNVEDRNLNIESEFFFYSLYDSQALTFFLLFWCFKGPSKSVPRAQKHCLDFFLCALFSLYFHFAE